MTCHLIDFPGAGSSRFDAGAPLSVDGHIEAVRRVVDLLGLDELAVSRPRQRRADRPARPLAGATHACGPWA
ncbi:MAG: hypothetical protein R2749_05015 [Acidimicrobiales bacterium]